MKDKPLRWLHGEVKTPPMSMEARREMGYLLRRLQAGELLSLPHAQPMPVIGPRCHELRVVDRDRIWRLVCRLDPDAVVILEVFEKKTRATPRMSLKIAADDCGRTRRTGHEETESRMGRRQRTGFPAVVGC